MTKNPLLNALSATLYIVFVTTVLTLGEKLVGPKDTFLAPIAMISLFTLSAAVMGFVFLYQPGVLYFDGKKKEGVSLFLKTLGTFGILTIISLALLFSGIFKG